MRDTGIGIAEDDLERVLIPFEQVESSLARKNGGTGLGLPYAKKLVELHGGTLRISSEPHKGTTVTITLPPERLVAARTATHQSRCAAGSDSTALAHKAAVLVPSDRFPSTSRLLEPVRPCQHLRFVPIVQCPIRDELHRPKIAQRRFVHVADDEQAARGQHAIESLHQARGPPVRQIVEQTRPNKSNPAAVDRSSRLCRAICR